MNFRYLDMNSYNRKKHFEYFNGLAYPYIGVTVDVDITGLIAGINKNNFPFFLTFCYCIARSANCVPEFRQRISDSRIIEFENCRTSHTVALENGTYCYCTLDCSMPFQEYLPYAIHTQEKAKKEMSMEDDGNDGNELIFISTLPWFSYTSLIQPVPLPADSNPRITWGKYYEHNSRILIPVSVLCHHALVDGIHISRFYHFLNEQINILAAMEAAGLYT